MSKEVWIGLFGLILEEENEVLPGCDYAYVNALAVASDRQEFESRVSEKLQELKFTIDEIEDVEPFSQRIENYIVVEEIQQLAEEAKKTGIVIFDTFQGAGSEGDRRLH